MQPTTYQYRKGNICTPGRNRSGSSVFTVFLGQMVPLTAVRPWIKHNHLSNAMLASSSRHFPHCSVQRIRPRMGVRPHQPVWNPISIQNYFMSPFGFQVTDWKMLFYLHCRKWHLLTTQWKLTALVWNLVSQNNGRMQMKGVWEQSAYQNVLVWEIRSFRRV
jgi:hypothetical protein